MNQPNKRFYIFAAFILGFLLCVGILILGALFWAKRDNSSTLARNGEVLRSDHNEDLRSVEWQRQNSTSKTYSSLSDIANEYSGLFDMKRAMLNLVDGATEQELVGMFRESLDSPMDLGSINTTHWLQSVVLTQLLNINETKVSNVIAQLNDHSAESVVYGIMQEWSQVHVNEAIRFLTSLDSGLRSIGFQGLIAGSSFLSRAELLAMGSELGYEEEYVTSLIDRRQIALERVSLNDLKSEFERRVDADDIRHLYQLKQKALSYVLAEGLDSLPPVLELFDSLPMDNMSSMFRSMSDWFRADLVSDISQDDPEGVFEYILRLDEDIDTELLSAVSEVWFATDPKALWNRLSGEDLSSVQEEVTEDVIRHWCSQQPDIALVSINEFPTKYHDDVYLEVAKGMTDDDPVAALELLLLTSVWPETPPDSSRTGDSSYRPPRPNFSIKQIVSDATKADPIATIEWLNSEASKLDDSTRQQYLDEVFKGWSSSDPERAFEMALQTPLTDGESGLEATVVGWLSFNDLDQAIALLPRVREGETKAEAYQKIARRLEDQDRLSDAIQLGNDLPENDREEYLDSLASSVGTRTPFKYLEAGIRELPSQELQSRAASAAFMFSGTAMHPDLTDQQQSQLKEYLTADDARFVKVMVDIKKKSDEGDATQ